MNHCKIAADFGAWEDYPLVKTKVVTLKAVGGYWHKGQHLSNGPNMVGQIRSHRRRTA